MNSNTNNDNGNGQQGGEMMTSKKECTPCDQFTVDNITEGINNVAKLDDMSACANCGKEGKSEDMNTCNKCKSVKYCNAACKKKHRKKHKKACERKVAELHDEKLFADPPPPEECPICMLPLPLDGGDQVIFESCCGKTICSGCIHAMRESEGKSDLCAFCRTDAPFSDEEAIERLHRLMDKDNAMAFSMIAGYYIKGSAGLPQDYQKANELYLKGGELGNAGAYFNLSSSYRLGRGVSMDMKKFKHYCELAAMMGDVHARHNLGNMEGQAGNYHRAMKHMMIAARAGFDMSLEIVRRGFMISGDVTKDEYESTLHAYHDRQKEMKSDARDRATAQENLEDYLNLV